MKAQRTSMCIIGEQRILNKLNVVQYINGYQVEAQYNRTKIKNELTREIMKH